MGKFENYLIASDIDGTLLWEANYVNPRNLARLHDFCEGGGHFALSTGRNHKDIYKVVGEFGKYITMPCILCNGSYLYDTQSGEIMNPQYFDRKKTTEFLRELRRDFPNIGYRASFEGGFLVPEDDTIIMPVLRHMEIDMLATLCPAEEFENHDLFKSVLIGAPEDLERLRARIEEHYNGIFTVTTSGPSMIELQPFGVSKSFQIPYLKKLYPGAELWCIGDYDNDIEMLRDADVSVCPANAMAAVKAICDLEVCHCKDGALAELIDEIEARIEKKNG